ncbi:MAG: hypothetical protein DRJ63_10120 [Thermoprotei archaeon]|nr:MAG: hypothetical protein DRJ63_10120 [Thermoprotei archaeon]
MSEYLIHSNRLTLAGVLAKTEHKHAKLPADLPAYSNLGTKVYSKQDMKKASTVLSRLKERVAAYGK